MKVIKLYNEKLSCPDCILDKIKTKESAKLCSEHNCLNGDYIFVELKSEDIYELHNQIKSLPLA